jgi:hypothetical protein
MARKNSPVSPSTTTSLSLSNLHIQLDALEKEHQSLLKQIKRKRTEVKNFVEQMRSLATEIFHRATPSFDKIKEIDQEIHALFAVIFANKKLGKQTRKNIEVVYHKLQLTGIISPKSFREEEDQELDQLFENSPQENNQSQERPQLWESSSGARTDESKKVRQTFLKLAEIFHPDKVTDNETQMSHTEVMKEINKAYQEGDLARLLEIERQYQVGESIDMSSENDLTRRCKIVEQQNEILKTQYENLKRELRMAKNTPEGTMVSDFRKANKQGIDAIDLMLKTLEFQIDAISGIRDFVKDFQERKITIQDFLNGPSTLGSSKQDMMEEMLYEMLEKLGEIG